MAKWTNTCEISSTSRAIGLFLHLLNIFPCLFQWFEKTVIAERTVTKISLKRRHANGYTKFVITFYPVLHSYAILILCPISYFLILGYLLWGIFNFKPPIDWLLVIIVIVIYFSVYVYLQLHEYQYNMGLLLIEMKEPKVCGLWILRASPNHMSIIFYQ